MKKSIAIIMTSMILSPFASMTMLPHAAASHAPSERSCGDVNIEQVLVGPRYGAMMRVSGSRCNWVCLDPEAEVMSQEVSDRVFSFVLSHEMVNTKVRVRVYRNETASACGNYPVVSYIRTPR